jgi:hypothetical protein
MKAKRPSFLRAFSSRWNAHDPKIENPKIVVVVGREKKTRKKQCFSANSQDRAVLSFFGQTDSLDNSTKEQERHKQRYQ